MAIRIRTRPQIVVNGTWQNDCRFKSSGALRWQQSGTYKASVTSDTMTDEVTLDFKKRSENGEVFCKPMSKIVVEEKTFPSGGIAEDATYVYSGTANYVSQPNETIPYISPPANRQSRIDAIKQIAGTQAYSRITSEEVLLLATMGELKESIKMLTSALLRAASIGNKVRKYYRKLRDCNDLDVTLDRLLRKLDDLVLGRRVRPGTQGTVDWRKEVNALKKRISTLRKRLASAYLAAENAWMEVRMGWRPFIGECINLHRALTKVNEGNQRQTFRGKAAQIELVNEDNYSRNMNGGTYFFIRKYNETCTATAGALCSVRINGFPDTYGLTKLPQTIWELTTLSWAIDYFFNVGEVIAAVTPDTYWEPLCSWTVFRSTRVETVLYNGRRVQILTSDTVKGGQKIRITTEKSRTSGVSIGFNFRPRLNLAKIIDLAAVTRQKTMQAIKLAQKALITRKRRGAKNA